MPEPIYLDHNATTPLLPEVVEAMRECWAEPLLNPGSPHSFGRRARRVLEDHRERIAELLGARTAAASPDRLIFTSGGTEANHLAILGLLPPTAEPIQPSARKNDGHPAATAQQSLGQLIISAVEHPSILRLAEQLSLGGWSVDRLSVDSRGVVRVADLARLLRPQTRLVSVLLAQNETGALQPIDELAAICAEHRVPFHTDAVQAAGKIRIDFRALGASTMSVAAHKFHGPIGIGALVVRHDVALQPQMFGGLQQGGLRPGTESVALVVGMCRALELSLARGDSQIAQLRARRDRFERAICAGWPRARVLGSEAERLPNTSQIALVGLDRQALFMALDQAGVACSLGSACASGSSAPSTALLAMGCDQAVLTSALRFSLAATTTDQQIDQAVQRILSCCNHLRRPKGR